MATNEIIYKAGYNEAVLRSHKWRTAANSASYLLPHLKPHMTLLDVGTGPGTIAMDFAEILSAGHVTGLECESSVLDPARTKAAERGLTNITFETGDVHSLPYPSGTFDVVHAHQVLQHVSDPVQALREMRRVAKPGGLVAARDAGYSTMTWYPDSPQLDAWHTLSVRVYRHNGSETDCARRLHVWAREAGFTPASITKSVGTWLFATPEDRAFWAEMWANRLFVDPFATQAVEVGGASREELEEIARAWREWEEDEDAWFSMVHGEILCRV